MVKLQCWKLVSILLLLSKGKGSKKNIFIKLYFSFFVYSGAYFLDKWSCLEDNGKLFFPAFRQEDQNNSFWKDSMPGVNYVYPVPNDQANCSGRVTQIQFCFKYIPQSVSNVTLKVFTLTIMDNVTGREMSVNVSTSSYRLQMSDMSCRIDIITDTTYCCDVMTLENQFLRFLPMNNLTIKVSTTESSVTILQLFKNIIIPFSYSVDLNGNMSMPMAQSLAVVRFTCKLENFYVRM